MKRLNALTFSLLMLLSATAGCFGNDEISDSDDDSNENLEQGSNDDSNEDLNPDSNNSEDNNSIAEPEVSPYAIICPDGTDGTLEWGVVTCAEPEIFKTSDVSDEALELTLEWYNIAAEEWGNFGPVEIYVIGNDLDAAKVLEDEYCQRHKALDSKWNEEWDCANENYQIFTNYVDDGGAAISTFKRSHLDYDFFMMIMSSKYPGPEEEDYKPVTLHEYFHIFQHSQISDECSDDNRDTCERDSKMGGKGKPWFAEGGAEFMAQSLYSKQDGVSDNYLKQVMERKLNMSQEGYNSQGETLDQIGYDAQVNVYDVGAWFIAYLIHNEGVDAFIDGFYGDLDELGFNAAFEANFNKTRSDYLTEFDTFFAQSAEDVMAIFGETSQSPTPSQAPQQVWIKSVGGSQEESHGHFILACNDGGFLQIGETGFIPNSAKVLVTKVDENGDFKWKKEFGTAGHNLGNSAIEVTDGYVIVGAINEDSTVIKLDKQTGSTIFIETTNNGGSDALESIVETPTGFAAVGYIDALDRENTFFTEGKGHMVFLDINGTEVSSMSLNSHMAQGYRIGSYNNQLIISGLTEEALDYALMKMDMSGDVIWSKTYGGNAQDHSFAFDISVNGSIFLSGHTVSGTENWDTYTLMLNNDGDLLWENIRGNPRGFNPQYIHDEAWGLVATSDGGVIVVAGTGDEYSSYSECNGNDCSDSWRVYLIKYDSAGQLVWEATYAGEENGDWAGEDICLTSDGDIVVAVDNGEFGFLKLSES